MNTLEILPNEILFECFCYFTALDLFHSFDHLNQRFSTLIRSISLHVNFENVSNAKMRQFCHELQQNPSMKQKVHSLHLSDERLLQQTTTFLKYFSLVEFPSLKSLVLSSFEVKNAYKIILMLRSLPDLGSLILTCSEVEEVGIPDNLLSKFIRLTIPSLGENLRTTEQSWRMRRLTLSEVKLDQVAKVFQYAPKLIDFTIGNLRSESNKQVNFNGYSAVCLQRLHIECVQGFSSIVILLQHTPNLKVLTLIVTCTEQMMDAGQWEQLICSSLKDLEVFQFYFCHRGNFCITSSANSVSTLERFQSDFYVRQHHWTVQYRCGLSSVEVYTIPLVLDKYQLFPLGNSSWSKSINSKMIFDHVTDLSVGYDMEDESDSSYFSHLKILRFEDYLVNADLDQRILYSETIDYLKRNIDLSTVIDLRISYWYSFESSSVMLDLLNETPNISSITMAPQMFQDLSSDALVCSALKRMIKSLTLSSRYGTDVLLSDSNFIKKLCRTFPDLEQLTCFISHPWTLKILLRRLWNLSTIKINILADDFDSNFLALEVEYRQILRNEFHLTDDEIHFDRCGMNRLTIRIDRNIE